MKPVYTVPAVPTGLTSARHEMAAAPSQPLVGNSDSRNVSRHYIVPDSAFKLACHLVGGPGSGKSRYLGRIIGWQAFSRKYPVVVLDPSGGIIANVIDKISRLPIEQRTQLWPRILYVDAGATDYVVPSPLYYRLAATDTLFGIANRFPAVLKRQDPHLQSAPILGWNSLQECAIYSGQIAAALGYQLDFVADLIDHPRQYKEELKRALAGRPELEPAVSYFRGLMDPGSSSLYERRTGSFRNKLLPFLSDPTMLASFAAPEHGIDWDAVVAEKKMVLIDFQHELDPDRRQFKLIWWFRSVVDYIKQRGMAGRGREIFFLIDEVTQLLGNRSGEGNSVLAEDLEELVAVVARNYGANVVIAHQNLSQVDERVRNILMQCGTQIIGNISNPDDSLYLARQLYRYEPFLRKKQEPVWMGVPQFDKHGFTIGYSQPEVIDNRYVEYTPDEQLLLAQDRFRLPRFQFLVRPALGEGTVSNTLYKLSIEKIDRGQYPNTEQVSEILTFLRQKDGISIETALCKIHAERKKDVVPGAKMKAYAHDIPTPAQEEDEDGDESFRTKA